MNTIDPAAADAALSLLIVCVCVLIMLCFDNSDRPPPP